MKQLTVMCTTRGKRRSNDVPGPRNTDNKTRANKIAQEQSAHSSLIMDYLFVFFSVTLLLHVTRVNVSSSSA